MGGLGLEDVVEDQQKRGSFRCVQQLVDAAGCSSWEGREEQAVVVSELEGTLLKSNNAFPFYMLAAWEAPAGMARFMTLLLLWPAAWLLQRFVSGAAAIKLMAWIAFVGVKEGDIRWIARAVLPKFYAEDVHPHAWRAVSSFGRARYLLTANPRIMVEPFANDYLGIHHVLGSELHIHAASGRATGFLLQPAVNSPTCSTVEDHHLAAARFGNHVYVPADVALVGRRHSSGGWHQPFLAACKEGYFVAPFSRRVLHAPIKLCKPLIFHDGRLVRMPTPGLALFILLWLPFGVVLACLRSMACSRLPVSMSMYVLRGLGVRLSVRGVEPAQQYIAAKKNVINADVLSKRSGMVFASTHRTLMDPVFISFALRRPVTAVTFSLSRLSEINSPIPTIRLSRNKERDARTMKKHLQEAGDLVICPEGTTCREPFLLRFSALFAELSTSIVPVATKCHLSMFHATTARGWKGLDSFYFFLNPIPSYEITFFKQLPQCLTCAGGRSSHEVANFVQHILASTLGFKCTKFTRKDKYRILVGCDDHL